jgi:hypothetical protein
MLSSPVFGTEKPVPDYSKKHIADSFVIEIQSWGVEKARSIIYFQVMVYSEKGLHAIISHGPVDGVIDSFTGDLDEDGNIETYVITQSAGSGGYGRIYAFEINENQLVAIDFAELPSEYKSGYLGHDHFNIENNHLIREFPIYKESDPNALPSGGIRRVIYKLKDDSFVVEKVENVP